MADSEKVSVLSTVLTREPTPLQQTLVTDVKGRRIVGGSVELAKEIEDATDTTEFLMITLQKSFNFQPEKVHELLTNSNQYLMQACDKGIKGDYRPVVKWYELLNEVANYEKMIEFFKQAVSVGYLVELTLVLNSIRCGFYSQNEHVCKEAMCLVTRIFSTMLE